MAEYDVVIIGSGIAGMTSAIYLKRAGLKTLIIENNAPGGVLQKGYDIENYPGYPQINSVDLAANIYTSVNNLNVEYIFESIKEIDLENKNIITTNHNIKTKYIIIATGRSEKRLNIDNEEKLIGNGISFCANCDGYFFKDKDVIVVGGSNTAVTTAIYLSNICKKVTIIYRNDNLKAEKILLNRLEDKNNVNIIYNANIKKYNIENDSLKSVTLDNGEIIPTDGVFLAIGWIPNSKLFDVEKDECYIMVDKNYHTSIDKVYAIGDVIKKDVYQLTTAAGDATIAAINIINDIK